MAGSAKLAGINLTDAASPFLQLLDTIGIFDDAEGYNIDQLFLMLKDKENKTEPELALY